MDKYDNLVNGLLNELRGSTSPINLPEPATVPTTTVSTAGLPAAPATTTTVTSPPIKRPGPVIRTPGGPGPGPSGGPAGTLGLALTIGALTWEGLKFLRKQWEEKQKPLPMTLPPGTKQGDTVLPPLKAGGQGFIAPPQPVAPPEQQPATPEPERKPVVVPPVIPLRPGSPPETVPQPGEPNQTSAVVPTPVSSTEKIPVKDKEPEVTSSGEPGAENTTPVPGPADTSGRYPPPVPPIDTARKAIKPGRASEFDFKSYPQGYNPDEPYGRWGPKSAHRDTTQTSPWDLMKQTFTGTEPEVTSATPETETGPWAKRYKRYKDQYQDNPEAGQPTSFGNILKKSK